MVHSPSPLNSIVASIRTTSFKSAKKFFTSTHRLSSFSLTLCQKQSRISWHFGFRYQSCISWHQSMARKSSKLKTYVSRAQPPVLPTNALLVPRYVVSALISCVCYCGSTSAQVSLQGRDRGASFRRREGRGRTLKHKPCLMGRCLPLQ